MCPPLPAAWSTLDAGLQARGRLGRGPGFPPSGGAGGRAGGRAGRRWAGELCAARVLLLWGGWGRWGPEQEQPPLVAKACPGFCSSQSALEPRWLGIPAPSARGRQRALPRAASSLHPAQLAGHPRLLLRPPGCSLPLSSGFAWAPSPRAAAAPLTTQGPRRPAAALLQPAAGRPPSRLATTCCSTPSPSWPAPSVHSRPGGCRPLRSRKSSPPRSLPSPAGRPARCAQPRPGPSWGLGCPG